jgi:hypothetical protein
MERTGTIRIAMGFNFRELDIVKNLSRRDELAGTRKLMIGGALFAGVLFLATLAWLAVPDLIGTSDYVGRPTTGADSKTVATGVGTGVPTQREAQSSVAKNDPAGNEDATGGRARSIKQSSEPVSLSQDQRDRLRTIFSSASAPKMDKPNFELMIGTAVPRQATLADLPAEATQVLNGYFGGQYMMAGHDLVVVDQHTRRVAAIISGVGN